MNCIYSDIRAIASVGIWAGLNKQNYLPLHIGMTQKSHPCLLRALASRRSEATEIKIERQRFYTKKHLSHTLKLFRLSAQIKGKVFFMGSKAQSLAHTKWLCKYHIVFSPKYRRKIIFAELRTSIKEILRDLCK